MIEFGNPITVPEELVSQFRSGGADKRAAISLLMDTILTSLNAITVTAPNYDTLMVRVALDGMRKINDVLILQ